MGKSINLPETDGIRLQEDFLVACRAIDQEYATTCLRDVYKAENSGNTESIPTLDDYVSEFTAYLRRNRPHFSGLATVAADLKVATPYVEVQSNNDINNNNSNSNNNNNLKSKKAPNCLCGAKHWYSDCFIINREHPKRPANYEPPLATQRLVEEARRDQKIEGKIQSALERWRKLNQKDYSFRMDDGLPPSNCDTYIMSLSYRIYEHEDEVLEEEIYPGWNSNIIQMNDARESDELTTMAPEDDHTNQLSTRWIVDPGSNTHIKNSESWKRWKRERKNTERRTINAGNSHTLISAWGQNSCAHSSRIQKYSLNVCCSC